MSTLAIILYILGVIVIVGLAVYAVTLLKRLRYQNQLRQQAVKKRVDRIDESIITIAILIIHAIVIHMHSCYPICWKKKH